MISSLFHPISDALNSTLVHNIHKERIIIFPDTFFELPPFFPTLFRLCMCMWCRLYVFNTLASLGIYANGPLPIDGRLTRICGLPLRLLLLHHFLYVVCATCASIPLRRATHGHCCCDAFNGGPTFVACTAFIFSQKYTLCVCSYTLLPKSLMLFLLFLYTQTLYYVRELFSVRLVCHPYKRTRKSTKDTMVSQ